MSHFKLFIMFNDIQFIYTSLTIFNTKQAELLQTWHSEPTRRTIKVYVRAIQAYHARKLSKYKENKMRAVSSTPVHDKWQQL